MARKGRGGRKGSGTGRQPTVGRSVKKQDSTKLHQKNGKNARLIERAKHGTKELHPDSRKTKQLLQKINRNNKVEERRQSKAQKLDAACLRMKWFKVQVEQYNLHYRPHLVGEEALKLSTAEMFPPLSTQEVEQLVYFYLTRPETKLNKHIGQLALREQADASLSGGGFTIPLMTTSDGMVRLMLWDGDIATSTAVHTAVFKFHTDFDSVRNDIQAMSDVSNRTNWVSSLMEHTDVRMLLGKAPVKVTKDHARRCADLRKIQKRSLKARDTREKVHERVVKADAKRKKAETTAREKRRAVALAAKRSGGKQGNDSDSDEVI